MEKLQKIIYVKSLQSLESQYSLQNVVVSITIFENSIGAFLQNVPIKKTKKQSDEHYIINYFILTQHYINLSK